jgi:hypothetical protein
MARELGCGEVNGYFYPVLAPGKTNRRPLGEKPRALPPEGVHLAPSRRGRLRGGSLPPPTIVGVDDLAMPMAILTALHRAAGHLGPRVALPYAGLFDRSRSCFVLARALSFAGAKRRLYPL